MKFAPHIHYLDKATQYDASNFDFAEAFDMVNIDRINDLMVGVGVVKHPEGPVGQKFIKRFQRVFGYLLAACLNGSSEILFPFAQEYKSPMTRKIIIDTLVEGEIISLTKRGYNFAGGKREASTWKISPKVWYFLSEQAAKNLTVNFLKKGQTKANTKISKKVVIDGKTVRQTRIIEGVNDLLIQKTTEQFPFMAACQTIYNDDECKTNGRVYHPIQNLPKEHRETILSIMTGSSATTVDIKSSQIRLLLKVMGKNIGWTEDLYAKLEGVEDVSRDCIKLATSIYFNAAKSKMYTAKIACDEKHAEISWDQIKRIATALHNMSRGIITNSKGLGLRLMNIEGRMQTEMLRLANEKGILWFPMHDGGHCTDIAAEYLQAKMEEIIDRIINEMSMEERAEILGVSVDDLLLIMSGIAPKAEQKQQTDSADDAFIREFLESRKAA